MKSRYITPQIFIEDIEDNLLQTLSRTGVNTTTASPDNFEPHEGPNGSGSGAAEDEWADSKGGSIIWDWDDE